LGLDYSQRLKMEKVKGLSLVLAVNLTWKVISGFI